MTALRPASEDESRVNLTWLIRLRSFEIIVQLAVIVGVRFGLGTPLPLVPLTAVILVEIASNTAAAAVWLGGNTRVRPAVLALLLALDVLFFTALLGLTGGPYNPFSFLYLVPIALGALVLSAWWAAALAVLSFAADASLFVWHVWLPVGAEALGPHELHHLRGHVQGMWFALAVASAFIVYFIQRVRAALAQLADRAARNERLASLTTLAAGAAHELSTPLGTIAVVAKELERRLATPDLPGAASKPSGDRGGASELQPQGDRLRPTEGETQVLKELLIGDAQLVRREVERCRTILVAMAAGAGTSAAEAPRVASVDEIARAALANLPSAPEVRVGHRNPQALLRVPATALAQALACVVRNAQQASPPAAAVEVSSTVGPGGLTFEVADAGPGMPPEVASRAGEPFFTTRAPGEGMGLGLFLARTTAEQLGGRLEIDSRPGRGTRVRMVVPA